MCDNGASRIGKAMQGRPVVFAFGDFEADEALRELRRKGRPVELQATPLRLLLYLLRNRDRVISKEELLDRVWCDAAVSEGALSTALNQIRSALGDDGSQQRVIQTVRGRGYRLIALVEEHLAVKPAKARPVRRVASDFVGRHSILDRLDAALEEALAGHGRIALLAGEPGIGKTRTAGEFAAAARSGGLRVHAAWCREEKGAPPYWPWVQLLRGLIGERDADALRSELGAGAARIARIVPEIRERLPDLPESSPEADPEEARFRLFDAIAGFLGCASTHEPRILILDDLHWAGGSSLQLLEFLARGITGMRVLLLGTYRDVEVDGNHPLALTLAELARQDVCTCIPLAGLRPEEVRELVHRLAGSDPSEHLVAEVLGRTDGNPFFIRELVSLLGERASETGLVDAEGRSFEVPAGVRAVIRGRLQGLSPTCKEALETASAVGREFAVEILEAASELGREPLMEALGEACRAGLVKEAPKGGYRFAHALTREAIYAEQSALRRARLHGRVGEALERLHAADPDPHLADLARHFGAAGDAEKAVSYATRAGHLAMDQLAWEEAAEHFEAALRALERTAAADPIQRCDLLLALGWALHRGGHNREVCRESFLEVGRIARRCGDAERLAQAASGFALYQQIGIFDERGLRLLEEALEVLGPAETPLRAKLLSRLALLLRAGHQLERADAVLAEAIGLARRLGDPETGALVAHYRPWVLFGRVRPEDELEACAEALRLAEAGGFREIAAAVRLPRVHTLLTLGDLAKAEAEVTRLARDVPWYRYARFALAEHEVMKALLTGRFDDAERLIEKAQQVVRRMRDPYALASLTAATYLLRREQGRLSELEPGLRAWVEQQPDLPIWRCAFAHLLAELGRTEEARREFEALSASEFAALLPAGPQWLPSLVFLAEVCVVLEDELRAEVLYGLLQPHARLHAVFGNATLYYGSVTRPLASLAGLLGRFDQAERHFETALQTHRRMGALPWLAHTQHDFARMLLARGEALDRRRALELAGDALATACELGMAPLAERAEALRQEIQGAIPLRTRRRRSPR
jgi:DNA-binding winged helix-turn-helix (wHTH) protein/tetratricopeptide (TPR) repeat protein